MTMARRSLSRRAYGNGLPSSAGSEGPELHAGHDVALYDAGQDI